MAQAILPIFPEGTTPITKNICFEKKDGRVAYFHYLMPIFSHEEDDIASFRIITAQFYINGYAKQSDIIKAFGVPKISVSATVGGIYRLDETYKFQIEDRTAPKLVAVQATDQRTLHLGFDEAIEVMETSRFVIVLRSAPAVPVTVVEAIAVNSVAIVGLDTEMTPDAQYEI